MRPAIPLVIGAMALSLFAGCTERPETVPEETAQTIVSTQAPDENSTAETTTATAAEDPGPQEEPEDELYDTTPISQAYLTGDTSGLDDEQLQVLEKASEILDHIISEDMSDYEKELAVHDYMIYNCEYDTGMLGIFEHMTEGADRPYGCLILGESICSGYTTTFQMFMDMLCIPCVSIKAAADGGDDHAWNQVELDGKYYYVDVTWDDPVPDRGHGMIRHEYFNVTEAWMMERHQWDRSGLPPADGGENSYLSRELHQVSDPAEISSILDRSQGKLAEETYFRLDGDLGSFLGKYRDGEGVNAGNMPEDLKAVLKDYEKANKKLNIYYVCYEFEGEKLLMVYMQKKN